MLLRIKKENPFSKRGLVLLVIAGAVCTAVATLVTLPISAVIMLVRSGAAANPLDLVQSVQADSQAIKEMLEAPQGGGFSWFIWTLIDMFFSAALVEEGLKFITCRIACKRQNMIHTWMDSVIAFAFVGNTFELIANFAFGMDYDLLDAILRSLAPGHFQFGIIMGYFFGKYLVTGEKKYRALSLWVPVCIHTLGNTLVQVPYVSYAVVAAYTLTACIAVYILFRWHKNGTLDVPVAQQEAKPAHAVDASATRNASARAQHALKNIDEHEFTTYPRRFKSYSRTKSLLFAVVYGELSLIAILLISFLSRVIFGDAAVATGGEGYDGMDFYTPAGAFENGAAAAIAVPLHAPRRAHHPRPPHLLVLLVHG